MLIIVAALGGETPAYGTAAGIIDVSPGALFPWLLLATVALFGYLIIRFFTHRTDRPKTSDYVVLLAALIAAVGTVNTYGDEAPTPTPTPTPAAVVPDVVFLPRNEAIAQLDTAGLAAAVICLESPSVEATGVAYATTPPAFERVEPGTEVKLYVNPPCASASGTASPPGQ